MPNTINQNTRAKATSLVKIIHNGQMTLPVNVRRALQVADGDYVELELYDGRVELRPVSVVTRDEADRKLEEILSRVKYIGPMPPPSADELASQIAGIIRHDGPDHAEGGAR